MSSRDPMPGGPAAQAPTGPARPAARLAVRLSRGDLERRVTVRYRLPEGESASLSDVVGVLVAWGIDDVLHVRRRDGSTVRVARADVVAAKVVPPPPTARPTIGSNTPG
jgi:hypothetical protein